MKSTNTRKGNIMDEIYSQEMAEYIFSIFCTNLPVVWSWGINPTTIQVVEMGVKFHVQGFKHTGYAQVVLNKGEDLFEVSPIDENNTIVNIIGDIEKLSIVFLPIWQKLAKKTYRFTHF